ncbi:MAG: ABC transporter substrate binding protein, partial [Burkholderiales bacterium]
FLENPANPATMLVLRELQAIAQPLGVAVQILDASSRSNVERAFSTIARERIGGIFVGISAGILEQGPQIVEAAARQRVPAIFQRKEYVEAGGLLSYGADVSAIYSRAADLVHRVLEGTKPAEMPFEQASAFKLVVNLKTAKALGIKIPQSVLVRADEVIQ